MPGKENCVMRSTLLVLVLVLVFPFLAGAEAAASGDIAPPDLRAQGDTLRQKGDYQGALEAYEKALKTGDESASLWKLIASIQQSLGRYRDAAASLAKALTVDPNDGEARAALESLRRSRGLTVQAWFDGSEPDASKAAAEAQLQYAGLDAVTLRAGGGWTDEIFYYRDKAYMTAYWFYAGDSYLSAGLAVRKYDYSAPGMPAPDSNAYQWEPRAELQISHWIAPMVRLGAAYQLSVPDFQFDPGTWIANHKLTADAEVKLGAGFSVSATAALLRDPDPNLTKVANTPAALGGPTSVVSRLDWLFGGGASYDAPRWNVGVQALSNRDLDTSFDWSVLSSLQILPFDWLSIDLQWILDHYAAGAGAPYAGNLGNIVWAECSVDIIPPLRVSAGAKYVNNPGPTSLTDASPRNNFAVLLALRYRTGIY
jgi:tetratricopeptide (TPR) repeat protein